MPPLRSIAADLDPLLAFHKDTIAQLDAIGIKSDKSLLLAADNYITSNTKLSLQTIRAFRDDVINECKAAPVRADDLFLELEQKERCLSTGCNRIDSLLDGGMLTGEITELAGPSASGKTQLAFFTIATTLAADPTAAVLYIDTCNTFEPARVRDLLARAGRFEEARKGGMDPITALCRIRHAKCFDVHAVLAAIEDVRYAILDAEIRPEDDPFHANLRLVVVDSASAVLSTLLTATQSQGHALMTTFARSLRSLATAHHIAILVVTSSVSSTPSFPLSAFAATNTKPGLGASWTFLTDVQLYLSRPTARDESEGGGERVCEVVRARRVATGRWCVFYVTPSEVVSP